MTSHGIENADVEMASPFTWRLAGSHIGMLESFGHRGLVEVVFSCATAAEKKMICILLYIRYERNLCSPQSPFTTSALTPDNSPFCFLSEIPRLSSTTP